VNAPLRRVSVAVFVLLGLLFVNLNYWQVSPRADQLRTDPGNRRVLRGEYDKQRGFVVVNSESVAESKATGGELNYERRYNAPRLYANPVGYKSIQFGSAGIEDAEDQILSGQSDQLFVNRLTALFSNKEQEGGTVVLTLQRQLQKQASDAIGDRLGSAVVLDPRTGAVLAMVSHPTYDPNPLVSNNSKTSQEAWQRLQADPDEPLLNRTIAERYPPGSTFKIIDTAAALESGYTPDSELQGPASYTPPQTTTPITNFEKGQACVDGTPTLRESLKISCNTSFSKLAVDLGAEKIRAKAKAFGFDDADLTVPMKVAKSTVGDLPDPPSLAQSGIGQRDVRMTPLQGAMLAAAVANNGTLMRPYLVSETQAPDFSTLRKTSPKEQGKPVSGDVAKQMQSMMETVVADGTGTKAQNNSPGVRVGGKTGTAQDGDRPDHTWFVGYEFNNDQPVAAVCVMLENTGGKSSEPTAIAGDLLRTALKLEGGR
jgi:peptidoglycan glycosyltransferase